MSGQLTALMRQSGAGKGHRIIRQGQMTDFSDILAMLGETTAQVGPGLSILMGPSFTFNGSMSLRAMQ